jgi:hypothetical protein
MQNRLISFAGVLALTLAAVAPAVGADEMPPVGFDALVGFDKLPLLVDWPAYQDSSYHRDDINQDAGNFIRVEPNGELKFARQPE